MLKYKQSAMTTLSVKSTSHPKRELRKQLEIQLEKVLTGLLQKAPEKKLKKHVKKASEQLAEALVDYSAAAVSHQSNASKVATPGAIKTIRKITKPISKKPAKPIKKETKKAGK